MNKKRSSGGVGRSLWEWEVNKKEFFLIYISLRILRQKLAD